MAPRASIAPDDYMTRLGVIEEKLETLIGEIGEIRKYIPCKMVEYEQRITVLERNVKTSFYIGAIIAIALIGAFVGHVIGGR